MRTHRTHGETEERAHIWKHRDMYATFRDVPCFIQIQERLSGQLCLTAGNSQKRKEEENVGDDCEHGETLTS